MKRVFAAVGALLLGLATPTGAFACSPPFDPSIRALGPEQIVLVGTTGERVDGGRLFHVERSFKRHHHVAGRHRFQGRRAGRGLQLSGGSWPAPDHRAVSRTGRTAQRGSRDAAGGPDSEAGAGYLAEAIELFGQGYVPAQSDVDSGVDLLPTIAIGGAVILGLLAVTAFVIRDRARTG
jgi:hypothetical protein